MAENENAPPPHRIEVVDDSSDSESTYNFEPPYIPEQYDENIHPEDDSIYVLEDSSWGDHKIRVVLLHPREAKLERHAEYLKAPNDTSIAMYCVQDVAELLGYTKYRILIEKTQILKAAKRKVYLHSYAQIVLAEQFLRAFLKMHPVKNFPHADEILTPDVLSHVRRQSRKEEEEIFARMRKKRAIPSEDDDDFESVPKKKKEKKKKKRRSVREDLPQIKKPHNADPDEAFEIMIKHTTNAWKHCTNEDHREDLLNAMSVFHSQTFKW